MRKLILVAVILAALAFGISELLAYGEGPSDSGRWVEGSVLYADGSTCRNCCGIRAETSYGLSKSGCTNDEARYRIYISSDYVKAMYFKGSRVWTGSLKARGGARIDLPAS